ncbi:glycosyltransferase family 2 protein [Hymenobacter sp. 5516J-16]|uniref:glycosyltransferase family 2 protein n=1 Tax=Hymenobacter sp. 5516J-16 TaxID=2932253 RepID=UPI001FD0B33F|nr:glycosyltransferase family 2 protein [Hymenobacter sp. 5516J-16]UOQ76186.1 glycosyltransferase family 2 protein [Hymenobacter sp. 5516J-16]
MPLTTALPLLSVVSPVYQASAVLDELVRRLEHTLTALPVRYEIILVDDGSADSSWELICRQAARTPCVRGLRLSRNFGQHHAITAGLEQCQGEWVVVMDCDLQDQPEEITRLWLRFRRATKPCWPAGAVGPIRRLPCGGLGPFTPC